MSLFFHMSLFFFTQDLHLRLPPPGRPAEKRYLPDLSGSAACVSHDIGAISAGIIY